MADEPDTYGRESRTSDFVILQLAPRFAGIGSASLADATNDKELLGPLEGLSRVLKDFGSPPSQRLIRSVPLERLLELEKKAAAARNAPPYSLASFWRVDLRKEPHRVGSFIEQVQALPEVVNAYADSPAAGPAVPNPGNNTWFTQQGYLQAADGGVDALYAWLLPGGDGAGVTLYELESGWNFAHVDLAPQNPAVVFGDQNPDFGQQDHGTKALGIMVARNNNEGVVGIAPGTSLVKAVSHYDDATHTPGHVADAITFAANEMDAANREGDVLVLEVETYRSAETGWPDHHPMEIKDAELGAIQLAIGLNMIVIEAAGNAGTDLDAYVAPQGSANGKRALWRDAPTGPTSPYRESGAIMVAAATSTVPHKRWSLSNFGSRIDCYAWGEKVASTGGGDLVFDFNKNRWYTKTFNATSAATAIIGGVALVIQGIARAATGQPLKQLEMQTLLKDWTLGTKVYDQAGTTQIGVMPDLRRLLKHHGLAPDVYLRDTVGDNGAVPSANAVGASPDIIVVNQAVADPTTAFGQGSGVEDNGDLSTFVAANADNYIYVRMKNRGASVADGTTATVYWSEPATLVTPGSWNLIGTTAPVTVPRGDTLVVTQALVWPAASVPPSGHYCCVAFLDTPADTAPPPPAATDMAGFYDLITRQNNVAWKNINVAAALIWKPLRFHIVGTPDRKRPFNIEVIQSLPDGVRIALKVPADLAAALALDGWRGEPDTDGKTVTIALPAAPRLLLAQVLLERDARHYSELVVDADKGVKLAGHSVTIRQLDGDLEVGRLTWRFADEKPAPKHAS